jgi:O-antigen ligase
VCTQSLGGLVSFGGVVVLAILCFAGNRKKKLALLGAVCALAVVFYFAKGILNPAHEGAGFAYDQSIRLVLWGIAWNFFTGSPLLGVGWGNFSALYGSYVTDISWIPAGQFEVHNIYLQLLAETGLAGFSAFFLLIFRAVLQAFSQLRCSVHTLEKALAFGVLGAILTVLLHGFVDFFFQVSPQFGTLFWVLLALLVVSDKTVREPSAGEQELRTA